MQKLKSTRRKHKNKTEQLRETYKQNINTGYPVQDPTANKYLSGSGWEIMYLCSFCFVLCFFLEVYCCFVVICAVFDCKRKCLNRLGENIQQNRNKHGYHVFMLLLCYVYRSFYVCVFVCFMLSCF